MHRSYLDLLICLGTIYMINIGFKYGKLQN